MKSALPRLYHEFASWWPLVSAREDYEEEARFFKKYVYDHLEVVPKTMLELGSGGGNNASYLKADFRMTLVDLSRDMLKVSAALNPECEHIQGDMRTVRLDRQFDTVFIHDAIMYITSGDDLARTMETAHLHCRPGGVALFAPDVIKENFSPSTDHHGHDGKGRSIRYLEWTFDPDPGDTTFNSEFAILLREADGRVRCEQDRHLFGLFPRDFWLATIREAGFDPKIIIDPFERELFIGVRHFR